MTKSAAQFTGGIVKMFLRGVLPCSGLSPSQNGITRGAQCQVQGSHRRCWYLSFQPRASASRKVSPLWGSGTSGVPWNSFLTPGPWGKLLRSTKKSLICCSLSCYQKVHGGCIISYVGMLVTLTGMEMTAQGSPCCSRERLIMYLEEDRTGTWEPHELVKWSPDASRNHKPAHREILPISCG